MKKFSPQWILILLSAACILFGGINCARAMVRTSEVRNAMDKKQLAMQDIEKEIDETLRAQEEAAKEERQKALDKKKAKDAKKAAKEAEKKAKKKTEKEEASEEESGEEEEPVNSFEQKDNGRIVGIDPGHQGSWVNMSDLEPNAPGSSEMKVRCTTGTTGNYTGLEEYQLNLDVSLKLRDILQERGYQVVMTREDNDANISNAERAQKVASEGADIYVRIHANSSDDSSVSGALTMCQSAGNPYVGNLYEESYRLSETILNYYCQATGIGNRGVMLTDTMTGINWSSVPVTILEMGFMSNQGDDTTMADSAFQQTMAQGIADGIDAYFGVE